MPHLRCRLVSTNTAPDQQQFTSTRMHTHIKRLQTLYGLLSSACSCTRAVTKASSRMYTTLPYTACHFQGFHHSGVHSNYERVGFLHCLLHIFPLLAFVGYQVACYRAYRRQTGARSKEISSCATSIALPRFAMFLAALPLKRYGLQDSAVRHVVPNFTTHNNAGPVGPCSLPAVADSNVIGLSRLTVPLAVAAAICLQGPEADERTTGRFPRGV
jgi:hypothetical protein